MPFSGNSGKSAATVVGHVRLPGESARGHYSYGVDGDYFAAMGFSLREGRFLTAEDSRRPTRVCVVDEDFARYYWPNASALGQRLFEGGEAATDARSFTVVGVVGAVKQAGLTDQTAQGAVYYPYAFRARDSLFIVVRTSLRPESLGPALQKVVRQIDPEAPVNDLRSMDTRIADSLVAQRSPAFLAGIFSLIAILLVGVGVYGVLSYAVAQRRREIGLRMALGARPGQIRSQFLALALRLLAGRHDIRRHWSVADRPSDADVAFSGAASSRRDPCRGRRHRRRGISSRLSAAISARRPDLPSGGPSRLAVIGLTP